MYWYKCNIKKHFINYIKEIIKILNIVNAKDLKITDNRRARKQYSINYHAIKLSWATNSITDWKYILYCKIYIKYFMFITIIHLFYLKQ